MVWGLPPKGGEAFRRKKYPSLGETWRDAEETHYDLERARCSVRIFDCAEIPRVNEPISPAVSRVRFSVDLSGVNPMRAEAVSQAGPLFAGIVDLNRMTENMLIF